MIILSGADVVAPDRVLAPGTVVIEDGRIVEVSPGEKPVSSATVSFNLRGHCIAPGFIDVHVHGVGGHDLLDGPHALASVASGLPRFGVTAFCPTTVACPPAQLRGLLEAVRRERTFPTSGRARVLPAHLESNFLNAEYRGAQPAACLRRPPRAAARRDAADEPEPEYSGADIVAEIERARPDVAIVTLAPELDGALALTRTLVAWGVRVSLGHSGATLEQGLAAIDEGARHATHLFNRMPPLHHRAPGLAGAVLHREEVAAELVCDGHHVHPAVMRVAIGAKRPERVMAITDGTAGSGLPPGAHARLAGQAITARQAGAYLDDGTLAGSTLTMDGAFRMLAGPVGLTLVEAAAMCSTTPARELGLLGHGLIAPGAVADLVVLDRVLNVVYTFIGGELAYSAP